MGRGRRVRWGSQGTSEKAARRTALVVDEVRGLDGLVRDDALLLLPPEERVQAVVRVDLDAQVRAQRPRLRRRCAGAGGGDRDVRR